MLTDSPQDTPAETVTRNESPIAAKDEQRDDFVATSASVAPPPIDAEPTAAEASTSASPRKFFPLKSMIKLVLRKPVGAAGGTTTTEPEGTTSSHQPSNGPEGSRRLSSLVLKPKQRTSAPPVRAVLIDVDDEAEATSRTPPTAPPRRETKAQGVVKRLPTAGVFAARACHSRGSTELSRSDVNCNLALQHLHGSILQRYDPKCALQWFFRDTRDCPLGDHVSACIGDRASALQSMFLHAGSDDHWEDARGHLLDIHWRFVWWRNCYWTVARAKSCTSSDRAVLDVIFQATVAIQRLVDIESEAFGVHRPVSERSTDTEEYYYPFALKPDRRDWLHTVDSGWKSEASRIFRFPVDLLQYQTYVALLAKCNAKPVSLSDVYDRIRCGDSSAELEAALQQIKTNCDIFNGETSQYSQDCKLLLSCMKRVLKPHDAYLAAPLDGLLSSRQNRKALVEECFQQPLQALAKTTVLPKRLQSVVDGCMGPAATRDDQQPSLPRKLGRKPKKSAAKPTTSAMVETQHWVQCGACEKWHVVSKEEQDKHRNSEHTTCMDIADELCSPRALAAAAQHALASTNSATHEFTSSARQPTKREVVDVDLPSSPTPSPTTADAHRRNGNQSRGRGRAATRRSVGGGDTKASKRSRSSSSTPSVTIAEAHRRNGKQPSGRGRAAVRGGGARGGRKAAKRARSASSSSTTSSTGSTESSGPASAVPSEAAIPTTRLRRPPPPRRRRSAEKPEHAVERRDSAHDTTASGSSAAAPRVVAPPSEEEVKMQTKVIASLLELGPHANSAESSSLFPANPFASLSLEALQRRYREFLAFEQELKKFA